MRAEGATRSTFMAEVIVSFSARRVILNRFSTNQPNPVMKYQPNPVMKNMYASSYFIYTMNDAIECMHMHAVANTRIETCFTELVPPIVDASFTSVARNLGIARRECNGKRLERRYGPGEI